MTPWLFPKVMAGLGQAMKKSWPLPKGRARGGQVVTTPCQVLADERGQGRVTIDNPQAFSKGKSAMTTPQLIRKRIGREGQ